MDTPSALVNVIQPVVAIETLQRQVPRLPGPAGDLKGKLIRFKPQLRRPTLGNGRQ